MLVDDDDIGRLMVEQLLVQAGASVEMASDGVQALERCDRVDYDIVLMDLHMPHLSGSQTARRLRDRSATQKRIPRIVALTADVFGAAQAWEWGFDACLTKPLDIDALLTVVVGDAAPAEEPLFERLVDPKRVEELRQMKTVDGETFFERFASRVVGELRSLADGLDRGSAASREHCAALAHRLKGAANIVGAAELSREAAALQTMFESGGREWAAVPPVVDQARRVADALERMLG